MRRQLGAVIGGALAVLALVFCVRALAGEWDRVSESLRQASLPWLAVAVATAATAMTAMALRWSACIRALGGVPPAPAIVVRWYYAGELGKYIPGGVWPVLGRGELARRGGISRSIAYGSVALSLVALYGAAVLPLGLLALHPAVVGAARRAVARVTRRELTMEVPDLPTVARLLVGYLPAWIAVVACTWSVARALDVGGSPWRLALATLLSWVAGFAVVPVPAGAGVREAVFIALAGLPAGLAAAVAITARVCFIVVDGVGGAVSAAGLGRPSARTAVEHPEAG